jgi:hypothetical protein
MTVDRSFVEENRAATNRIRKFAESLSDAQLQHPIGEHWTAGVMFAHMAFWDGRVMAVLDATEQAGKFAAPSIDLVVNDISLDLWKAIPPREAAKIALTSAEKLDKRLETYPPNLLEQVSEFNVRYLFRSRHRNEHLDEAEQALKA